MKIFERILGRRVREIVKLSDNQYGFVAFCATIGATQLQRSRTEDTFRAQSYREAITVFMDEVECFLEEQELNYEAVTAIIDGLDSTHSAHTPNMGKKKTPTKKAATETLDAGDVQSDSGVRPCFHERSATSEMSEEHPTALQLKITQMQEHSARLIAEYNKKLDALIRENAQLSQEIQEFRSLDMVHDSASSSAEPQRLRSYMNTTFALLTSMTSEISDFRSKRDRIVENAKGYLTSVSEASVDGGTECELTSEGDAQLMEAILDKLTQSIQRTERMSGGVEGLDDSSTFQTASSSEPWNSECPSQLSASILLLKQQELSEQLISERMNHEEKLSSLRSLLQEERERRDALQFSFDDLNRRYGDAAKELDRTRTTYNQVVDELESTRQENIGRLSKQAESYELEIAQCKEFAQRIEGERSTLRMENNELSENLTAFEHRITLLQANELEVNSRYEDLLRKCRSLEESLAELSRGPNGNPGGLRTRLEDNSEISGHCDTILSNGEEVLESKEKDLMSSSKEKQLFSQRKYSNGPQEQRGEKVEEAFLMESEICALNEDLPYSMESVVHTNEMQESPSAVQIELLALKEENAALTSRISEYKEIMRSTEKDLEETRCCYANEKEKYLRQTAESDELWRKKLRDTEGEVVSLNRRITSTELELSEATSLNTELQSRIRDYEAEVSEINRELCSKMARISALEDGLQIAESSLVDAQRQRAIEVAMLKEELDDANALLDRLSCQLEVNSRKQAVEECERQLAVAKNVATHSENQIQLVTDERDRAISELNSTKAMLHEVECRLSDSVAHSETLVREFGTEREKLSNEFDAAIKSEESLVEELSNVNEELIRKEELCEDLQTKIARLNEESKMLSSKLSEVAAEKGAISRQKDLAVEECEKAQKVLKSVECSLLATTAQRDELRVRVSDLCSACKELEDRLAALTSSSEERCSSLEAALEESEKRAFAAAALEEVLRSKNNDFELLQSKTQRMEEDLLAARAQLDQLSEHISSLLQTLMDRDSAVERLETEVAKLQMQLREKQENDTALQLQSSVEKKEVLIGLDTAKGVAKKRGEETIAHLRDDNVRLERELCSSHEQLECAKGELAALRLSIEHSDAAALKARNDNQRLMEQLERALFEREQTLAMAGEGQEAATRVIALERSIAVLKSEHAERMKQALEDLESSEHKLRVLKDSAEQARNQREEAVGKMESWRSRFELAAQEIESLTRSIEEVRHLESALEKSRAEQTALYEELTSQRSFLDRVLAEKNALLDQVTALNGQLDERTNRLRQVGEAKMDTTLRIVELESQVAALLRERDGVAVESEFNRASCSELTANISGPGAESAKQVVVQIEGNAQPGEVERLRADLQKAQERIAELEEFEGSVGDNHVLNAETSRSSERLEGSEWPYQFISASTPFPSLVTLLSRRFNAFRHRPARALMPYFRFAMAAYSILLHIMLIHCWFFAVCP